MAPTTYLPGNLQWLGLGKETTYGTAVAVPTIWIPVDSPKWLHKVTPLKDKALRGMMSTTFNQAQGMAYTDFSYKTLLYPDSIFPHLLAALGVADTVVTLAASTLSLGATNAPLAAPVITLGTAGTGGTFAAGTYFWKLTATNALGETIGSNELTATLALNGTQPINWTAITGATGYKLYRGTAAGAENVLVTTLGAVVTYTDTGTAGTAATVPVTNTSGGGTFAGGATFWKITSIASGAEGIGSNEVTATLAANGSQVLNWTAVTGATGYNVYRGTAAGAENVLVATLGAVTTYTDTGIAGAGTQSPPTTAASLHKSSVLNVGNPPSYTGFVYMADGKVKQIPGLVIASLKINIKANELPSMDVAWQGMPSATITAPTNTPSTIPPMPPFTANIKVAGTALGKYSDAAITIKRGTKPIPVLNGTQNPLAIYAGEVTVTGTLGAIFQGTADTDLTNLLTNGQPTLAVSINPQNDASHPLTIQCSKIAYETADPAPANSGWMTISSNFEAIANATDALDGNLSPVQAILSTTSSTPY